ncbi:hypothetical protein FOMPIDRAFT_126099 [Fomitopsis schrenkii]|uniref:Polysaccharide lyase 14 domain-containing protein n=1 Tax=Fomitopsis schrenkii TaxID=2126942 RepID=S8EIN0_FOMSC|nr:hypothetical protein FOMPIDRAFT_126099 [Fomitopsis schrenkii]
MPRLALLIALLLLGSDDAIAASSPIVSPATLASMYRLTTGTTLMAPTSTMAPSDARGLSGGKIRNGGYTTSSSDPASNNTSSPVLQVTYPAGSSHDIGGAQFYALFGNSPNGWGSMLITYEVAFDAEFDWVRLPGLRGGQDEYGCSGGQAANGTNLYAYVVESREFCDTPNLICNNERYGTSIDRGVFDFEAGAPFYDWNRAIMLVQLNNPNNKANGQVEMYHLSLSNLRFRTSAAADVNIGGLFFSTFFGGSNSSWATPNTTHDLRDFQLVWATASTVASNGT